MQLLLALLLCLCARTHSRAVHVSISTDWVACPVAEVAEYLADQSNSLFVAYLERLCNLPSRDVSSETALAIASELLPPSQLSLLRTSVGMGVYKPRVQSQHSISAHLGDPCQGRAFLVVSPLNSIYCDFDSYISGNAVSSREDLAGSEEFLAKNDHFLFEVSSPDATKVTIYGMYSSDSFCSLYSHARESLSGVSVAVRLSLLNASSRGADGGNTLHGYGVWLDIKNMEYKTLDDHTSSSSQPGDGDIEDADEEASKPAEGVTEDEDDGGSSTMEVKKIRDLGLQVIASVSKADDRLATLEDILYNFPSRASQLSKKRVTRSLRYSLTEWYQQGMHQTLAHNMLYLNGQQVDLSGASFNVFDVFAKLTSENTHLRALSFLPVSAGVKSKLVDLAISVNAPNPNKLPDIHRIDVSLGSKRVLSFINNLEKDAMYRRWPTSVRQLLMPAWSLHSVAKNMYTVIAIVDPLSESGASLLLEVRDLHQQQFPIRFGIVLSPGKVPRTAAATDRTALSEASWATRTHIVELFAFAREYMSSSAAMDFLMSLSEHLTSSPPATGKTGELSVQLSSVFSAFGSAIRRTDSSFSKSSVQSLALSIVNHEVVADSKYSAKIAESDYRDVPGLCSAYLSARNLPSNTFSLNGIAVTSGGEMYSELMQLLGREQYILSNSVRDGKITDETKSIFNALLEPAMTFPRFHPVIFEKEVDYIDTSRSSLTALLKGLQYLVSSNDKESSPIQTAVLATRLDADGLTTVASAIAWVGNSSERFRLSVLPYQVSDTQSDVAILVSMMLEELQISMVQSGLFAQILSAVASFDSAVCRPSAILESMDSSDALLAEQAASFIAKWNERIEHCVSDPSAHPVGAMRAKGNSADALMEALGLGSEQGALLLNGRVFKLSTALLKDDFLLFSSIESSRLTSKLMEIVSDERDLSADAFVDMSAFCGRYASSSKSRIDVRAILESNGISLGDTEYIMNMSPNASAATETPSSDISMYFIVDPLTIAAQRAVAVMKLVNEDLHLPFTLILVPLSQYDSFPLQNFYRFVLSPSETDPYAAFYKLPRSHVLTVRTDVPESWNTQAMIASQDIDNLNCDASSCGDAPLKSDPVPNLTRVVYKLKNLLVAGQCYELSEDSRPSPPKGLQLTLSTNTIDGVFQTDSLVMQNYGYFQLQANPGLWYLNLASGQPSAEFSIDGTTSRGKPIFVDSFISVVHRVNVRKRKGVSTDVVPVAVKPVSEGESSSRMWSALSGMWGSKSAAAPVIGAERIHVFSLATGHMYERLLRIMLLSVTKRTSAPVKFWLFENYLSPTFKTIAAAMSEEYGFEIGYVTYKWPEWLTVQTEKQRIIWGYKILFLDVLFPLDLKRIIYIDADQIMRADLKELWTLDLKGKPYAYTPFCSSREDTLGFQFWRSGFWASHLQGKPYHISALYVVDLETFRKHSYGDQLRAVYDSLAKDPNSLANLDQDLPNYAQHGIPIFSLPQEWLWCESWCSESSKSAAKTIDLCNNPLHKEPKLDMARRIVSGSLFNESWVELDDEIRKLQVRKGIA